MATIIPSMSSSPLIIPQFPPVASSPAISPQVPVNQLLLQQAIPPGAVRNCIRLVSHGAAAQLNRTNLHRNLWSYNAVTEDK